MIWKLLFLLSAASLPLPAGITTEAAAQARWRMAQAARTAAVPFPLPAPELRVFKRAHRLEVWAAGKRVRSYPTGLSHRGLADKREEGDHLTPEGRFYLCSRHFASAFHLFLGISYPNEAAAERGLRTGLINRQERHRILGAQKRRACPPWNTRLGGDLGIHGGGAGSDWTWGCIALDNAAVEDLWVTCPRGTRVVIEP